MGMRAAIVHYWLLNWRGGEKVLESLCRLLPDADIFTLFYDPRAVSPEIRRHNVTASFLNPLQVHDVVVELDVRVQDLARARVRDMRPHGVLDGGGQPADDRVAHILRAEIRI